MKKTIEIDLLNTDNFFQTYNQKKVSRELINYLIDECYNLKKRESIEIKIIVNDAMRGNINCVELIKAGLRREYDMCNERRHRILVKQVIYFILGFIVLFLATMIDMEVLREIVVICGWVLIWAMVELEIFTDVDSKKRRKILKKLLNSEYVENEL